VLLALTAEGAQRLVDGLTTAVSRVGLAVNVSKTEVLTVSKDMEATITYRNTGTSNSDALLPAATSPGISVVLEDLRRRRVLAWAAFRSIRMHGYAERWVAGPAEGQTVCSGGRDGAPLQR
jgi:hypothetical protein